MSSGDLVIGKLGALVRHEDGRSSYLRRGDALPEDLKAGEVDRLVSLGALARKRAPEAPAPDPAAAVSEPVTGENVDVLAMSTEDLSKLLDTGKDGKPLTIPETLALAENDDPALAAERARKVLEAEQHARGGDVRDGVTKGLAKIIEADPANAAGDGSGDGSSSGGGSSDNGQGGASA